MDRVCSISLDAYDSISHYDSVFGGTAHNTDNVWQYEMNGKVYSTLTILGGGPGDRYSAVYCLKKGDTTYYLAVSDAIIEILRGHAQICST